MALLALTVCGGASIHDASIGAGGDAAHNHNHKIDIHPLTLSCSLTHPSAQTFSFCLRPFTSPSRYPYLPAFALFYYATSRRYLSTLRLPRDPYPHYPA